MQPRFGYGMYDPALADLPEGAPPPFGIAGADIPELLDKIGAETGTEPDWQALAGELADALHSVSGYVPQSRRTHAALARYRGAIAQDGESPE